MRRKVKPLPSLLLTTPADTEEQDYQRANALFEHPRGCRCSTCCLAAGLGYIVRKQELARAAHQDGDES